MLVTVESGKAVRVAGDPDHPFTRGFLCAKVNRYVERTYHPDRLQHPLRRVGPKGSGRFERITWDDAYARIGRQDITASIDFTSVIRAGEASGLKTVGLTSQSEFLSALGIGEALAKGPAGDQLEAFYALRRSVVELTDPAGLGRIRVLTQSKGMPAG